MTTRVIGLGSHQGDDAAAWEVLRRLRTARPGLDLHAIADASRLIDLLHAGCDCILIDALKGADPPGTIHRILWPDARIAETMARSTHGLGVVETLRLAEALGLIPRRMIVYAIAGGMWQPSAPPSEAVLRQVDPLVARIVQDITNREREQGQRM